MSVTQQARAETGQAAPREGVRDLTFIGVCCAVLIVVTTFNALNVIQERSLSVHPVRAWEPFVWEGSSGVFILAVLPLIMALARRFWPLDRPRAPRIAAHVVFAILFSLGHIVTIGLMRWAIYHLAGGHYDALWPLHDWAYEMRKDVLVYTLILSIYVGWNLVLSKPAAASGDGEGVLEVRDGARRHFVPLSEVVWVEAAGNYVELHRGASGLLHRASLADMQRRLEGAGFVRIHRSRLVRRDAIDAIESKPTGDFLVRLRDGRELAGSRRYRKPLIGD